MQMPKILVFLFLIIPCLVFADNFNIVKQNRDYLVINFNLPEYKIVRSEKQAKFHKIIIDSKLNHSESGKPNLPYFKTNIGIPANGDITYKIINKKEKFFSNLLIEPTSTVTKNSKKNKYLYYDQSIEKYPNKVLNKSRKVGFRDRKYVSLLVNPFIYDFETNKLTVVKYLQIKIFISGDKEEAKNWRNVNNFIDDVGDKFFLNNQVSKKWRILPKKQNLKDNQFRTSEVNTIKIIVDQEGIYKINHSWLKEQMQIWQDSLEFEYEFENLEQVDPRYFELSDENGAVPIRFYGEEDGSFDDGDYFEFFGERHSGDEDYYDEYTQENTYFLKYTDHLGARLAIENGGIIETDPQAYSIPDAYIQELNIQKQNFIDRLGYYEEAPKEDIWFWRKIDAPDLAVIPFNIQYPYPSMIKMYNAEINIIGATHLENPSSPDHHAYVRINSSLINEHFWYQQSKQSFVNSSPIPNDFLNHGTNNLYISLPGDTPAGDREQVILDELKLAYWRQYKTNTDYIRFTKPQDEENGLFQFEVENLSSEQVSVYKKGSSYLENIQVIPFTENGNAPFKAVFQDNVYSNSTEYILVTEENKRLPKFIKPDIPSNLKNTNNSAEYVIITSQEFADNEGTILLKDTWNENGLNTKIVTVEDVFDEFNHGIRSAEAIKEFIEFAYNNWLQPRLKYVLFLGDGISDERDNSSNRSKNIIPYKNIWSFKHGVMSSDNWFGCIVGDDYVSDVQIGRINVWKEEQIMPVVEKTLSYLSSENVSELWQSKVTYAAGGKDDDPYAIFAEDSEDLREIIPKKYLVNRIYTATNAEEVPNIYQGGTFDLKDAIDDGTLFLQFLGHGGGRIWADYNLFNFSDVRTLNNDVYPIISSMSCFGSAFDSPGAECMGEALVLEPEKGGIGHIGFTGLGYIEGDKLFSIYLTEAIFELGITNISNALAYTKAQFYSSYPENYLLNYFEKSKRALTQGCAYLGDPAINIKLPQIEKFPQLDNYIANEGDTVNVSLELDDSYIEGEIYILDEYEMSVPDFFTYPQPVVNNLLTAQYVIPESEQEFYKRDIKIYAHNGTKQLTALSSFTVAKSNVVDLETIPNEITEDDSVKITAKIYHPDGIERVNCVVASDPETNQVHGNIIKIPMSFDSLTEKYITDYSIAPSVPGKDIDYYFEIITENQDVQSSEEFYYSVLGPDLTILDYEMSEINGEFVIRVLKKNIGEYMSEGTSLKLYQTDNKEVAGRDSLITSKTLNQLEPQEQVWNLIALPALENEELYLKLVVNRPEQFGEKNHANNELITEAISMNSFLAGLEEREVNSFDNNLVCHFPDMLLSEEIIFYLKTLDFQTPLSQEGFENVVYSDDSEFKSYNLNAYDKSVFEDSLGTFPQNNKVTLTFNYSSQDSLTQYYENEKDFYVYRWEETVNKWIYQGGFIDTLNNQVTLEAKRLGIYTLLRKTDNTKPVISANVQDQEFTLGGYISGNGIISVTLSDNNGIDVFDNIFEFYLNGETVSYQELSFNVNQGDLINIPIKYQLDLTQGDYSLVINCSDLNGNFSEETMRFRVNTEFGLQNLANYPNPIYSKTNELKNEGRTRFTYVLTDDADNVRLEIYTVSGRLVKTFKNLPSSVGYHEYPRTIYGWDCRDDDGYYLANGVYFYKVIAKKNNEKIEKIQKLVIMK